MRESRTRQGHGLVMACLTRDRHTARGEAQKRTVVERLLDSHGTILNGKLQREPLAAEVISALELEEEVKTNA